MTDARFAQSLPEELPADPMHWADAWIKEATAAQVQRNPNAMTLATIGDDLQPSARVVLCKEFVPDPGYLVFFTNYLSRKARELEFNTRVAAVLHWDALGRQIRIEGVALRCPAEESDAYFATRDRGSQLGAWGSDQSAEISSKQALIHQVRQRAATLGVRLEGDSTHPLPDADRAIRRPPNWGGYRLWATAIELWVEGRDRIHDRGAWTRDVLRASEHRFTVSPWVGRRLQP